MHLSVVEDIKLISIFRSRFYVVLMLTGISFLRHSSLTHKQTIILGGRMIKIIFFINEYVMILDLC